MPSPPPLIADPVGGNALNPLGMVNQLTDLQLKLNQNRQFQQQFMANQAVGEILAQSPDMETGMDRVIKSGLGGWAGPTIQNLKAIQLMNAQLQGEYQKQATDGWDVMTKAGLAGTHDFRNYATATAAMMPLLSPEAQRRDRESFARSSAIFTDVPYDITAPDGTKSSISYADAAKSQDPNVQRQVQSQFNNRYAGLFTAAGGSPEALVQHIGKPMEIKTGAQTYFGTEAPVGGTSFSPPGMPSVAGQPVAKAIEELPPTVSEAGKIPISGAGQGGLQLFQQGGGGPQGPGPVGPAAPLARAGSIPTEAASGPVAGDGKPLIADPKAYQFKSSGGGVGGMTPFEAHADQEAVDLFTKEGTKTVESARSNIALATQMRNGYDLLAQLNSDPKMQGKLEQFKKAFLVPGAGAETRLDVAKLTNMVKSLFGGDPAFSPQMIGTLEEMAKAHQQLSLGFLTQNLGQQREAATTIVRASHAMPGIENTVLGGRLLSDLTEAQSQYVQDRFQAENFAYGLNGGVGQAKVLGQFMKEHSPKDYIERVLDRYDMKADGTFKSQADLVKAYRQGYLTKSEADSLGRSQWGGGK